MSMLAGGLLVAGVGASAASAASTPMVDLGDASTYAALSGASVANTVSAPDAPHTTLRGDLGVKADLQPSGFPPGVVTGATRVGSAAESAHADLVAAYTDVAARTDGAPLAAELAGMTISPGLHTVAAAVSNAGTVTLDGGGDPNAVFVFQINGALAFAAGSHVVLTNGAQASRVFWQVNGAGAVGADADFAGTLMASDAVDIGANSLVNGRAFARNGALTLNNNQFYSSPPQVTIDGGAADFTTDTTPTISGTTDVEAPADVTVEIAGQTFSATTSDGTWSIDAEILANGTYPVLASVLDAAGNPGSASQQLTVDTVLPIVTLDGGPSVTTNDPTPTISGTSDVAADTIVRVTVDSQVLQALVHPNGTWIVRPTTLSDGTRTITASVSDPATNEGTDSQILTVDTVAPAATIAGGSSALSKDQTPAISGTAEVAGGTPVTVTLADETLSGRVGDGGFWSVTASALSNGPHRVVMSVSDAAGNKTTVVQTLTIDTVLPLIAITGGATATTEDVDPTIRGTSDGIPGATVTVTIAGQTLTTLLQAGGGWNVTPGFVGGGTWAVAASVPDRAGNVGRARQSLTIAATPPTCKGQRATIVGTDGDDMLTGTKGVDVIVALAGNDEVKGRGGNDLICLGEGKDEGAGNGGADTILGEKGDDRAKGGGGDDKLRGNAGRDKLIGGGGDDNLGGGGGTDVVKGKDGDDKLKGNGGRADKLKGGGGRDRLNGGGGKNDLCDGQGGKDVKKTKGCERVRHTP